MNNSQITLIVLAYVAFIALGMPDGVLGVAWPSIRATFGIPLDSMGALLLASVGGYLVSSFSSGYLIARFGVGLVLAASCALTGTGLIGYTLAPAWGLMVLLGVAAGLVSVVVAGTAAGVFVGSDIKVSRSSRQPHGGPSAPGLRSGRGGRRRTAPSRRAG